MAIIIANQTGEVDSAYHTLVQHIKSPLPIVMVSYSDNFVFNEDLLSLKQDEFILIDFIEMGWNYDWNKHSIENYHKRFNGDQWGKYHDWAYEKPLLCFKRELDLPTSTIEGYFPIEYPCLTDKWPIETREQFNNRPLNAFQYWGRSNEHRLRIHSEIWLHAYRKGFSVCDNLYYISEFLKNEGGEKWSTLWIPHWARVEINNLMIINNLSKLSLSWEGAGNKCFRDAEAPVNSVMVRHKNNMAWSFPWDESNSVLVEHGKEIEGIEEALKDEYLYDVYIEGMKNVDKYRLENYIPHLEKLINNVI